jgi:hypothetical protein
LLQPVRAISEYSPDAFATKNPLVSGRGLTATKLNSQWRRTMRELMQFDTHTAMDLIYLFQHLQKI